MIKRNTTILGLLTACGLLTGLPAHAQTRLKDIAVVQGVRGNQLVGYGLIVGLSGTGDGTGATFTPQSVASLLQKFGVTVPPGALKVKNVAAVMVTATLPPFVKNGSAIDVTVSSLGDAQSLQGGTLLQTPLQAANNQVYAVAQGPVSVGGFLAGGGAGGSVAKNFVTVGRIPGGALVEQDVPTTLLGGAQGVLEVTLNHPDFTTAARLVTAINAHRPTGATGASAEDAATIRVAFAPGTEPVSLIAALEAVPRRGRRGRQSRHQRANGNRGHGRQCGSHRLRRGARQPDRFYRQCASHFAAGRVLSRHHRDPAAQDRQSAGRR